MKGKHRQEGKGRGGRWEEMEEGGEGAQVCGGVAWPTSSAPPQGTKYPPCSCEPLPPQPFPHGAPDLPQGAQEEGALFQFLRGDPQPSPWSGSPPGSQPTSSHFLLQGPGW